MTGITKVENQNDKKVENENESKEDLVVIEDSKPSVAVVEKPTVESLRDDGWSDAEIKSAQDRGLAVTEEEKKETDDKAAEAKKKADEEAKSEEGESNEDVKKRLEAEDKGKKPPPTGSLPDMAMTPDQEKFFSDTFPPGTPQRAFYFRMKNERSRAQKAEAALKDERSARESLETRLKALEDGGGELPTDEDGKILDPNDAPLTMKTLLAMQAKQTEAAKAANDKAGAKHQSVVAAQTTQEEYVRGLHGDFDHAVAKATEIIQNFDSLVPAGHTQARARKLIQDLQVAAATADEFDLDDNHSAFIIYELGKLHPKYEEGLDGDGKPTKKQEEPTQKTDGDKLTPEQEKLKRIEKNTQRRVPSASVQNGGSKRGVAASAVTLQMLNDMPAAKRREFKDSHREHFDKLMRG